MCDYNRTLTVKEIQIIVQTILHFIAIQSIKTFSPTGSTTYCTLKHVASPDLIPRSPPPLPNLSGALSLTLLTSWYLLADEPFVHQAGEGRLCEHGGGQAGPGAQQTATYASWLARLEPVAGSKSASREEGSSGQVACRGTTS